MMKLTEKEIETHLHSSHKNWVLKTDSIYQSFQFKDFVNAFSFMTAIAIIAEKQGHHPNWDNVYNKVNISLSTHEIGGLTKQDFDLASQIDNIYSTYK